MYTKRTIIVAIAVASLLAIPATAQTTRPAGKEAPKVSIDYDAVLCQGDLAQARDTFALAVAQRPDDYNAQFALGVTCLLQCAERTCQRLYKYGMRPDPVLRFMGFVGIPVPQLPVARNFDPEEISYEDVRSIITDVLSELNEVEAQLARIPADANVHVPLHFGRIRADLDGSGFASNRESLGAIAAAILRSPNVTREQLAATFVVCDRADVEWLRGYCHLTAAVCEFTLAYDERELFERTATLWFPRVKSPYTLPCRSDVAANQQDNGALLDLVAAVHLLHFPLAEPQRLESARQHLLQMLTCSGAMVKMVLAETDDDHEWIPSPSQTGVMPSLRVSAGMVGGWRDFLVEARDLLEGRKLVPFWRCNGKHGVNLKRVFTEPQPFDLVLWVQGSAALPYLESGECTTPETWRRLQQTFDGRFWMYATYLN